MRLSSIFIPLALLFNSSVSAQDLITGTWSSPYINTDVSKYCCIPTSVQITRSGYSSCTADYKYPSSSDSKCWNLFMSSTNGNIEIYYQRSEYYLSNVTFYGKMNFYFVASNSTGYPRLNIYTIPSSYLNEICDFTMTVRTAPETFETPETPGTSGNFEIGGIIIFIIIFFVVAAYAGAKKYQSRQANLIIAQNLTHQSTVVTAYSHQPNAVIYANQGFFQPQPTYIAPNHFPSTQFNFGGNAQFSNNAQVNMNMNFGANNGQIF